MEKVRHQIPMGSMVISILIREASCSLGRNQMENGQRLKICKDRQVQPEQMERVVLMERQFQMHQYLVQ
jgi:hypothetical protein